MPKGYMISAHRSEADPVKRAAYRKLAKPALEAAGGKISDIFTPISHDVFSYVFPSTNYNNPAAKDRRLSKRDNRA